MKFIGDTDPDRFLELGSRSACRFGRIGLDLGVIIINNLAIDDGRKPFVHFKSE